MKTKLLNSIKSTLALWAAALALGWVTACQSAPTILATGIGNPGNLQVDGSSVYWIDGLTGQIKSVSKSPGGTVFNLGTVASGINDFVQDTSFLYYRINAQGLAINKVSKSGATTTSFGVDNYPTAAGSSLTIGPAGGVLYYDSDRDVPNDGVDAFLGMAQISTLGGADQVLIYQDPGYAGLLNGDNSSGEAALQLDSLPYSTFGGAPGASSTDSTYMYWQDGSYQDTIWQMPLVGGPPSAIVSGRTGIHFIATPATGAAAGSIFWIEGNIGSGRLMRKEVGGQIITVLTNIIPATDRCFAVDNDQVFCEQGGGIVQVSINGGAVTIVSGVAEVFGPIGLAVDANYIYCGNDLGQILRIPRPGGGGTTYTVAVSAAPSAGGSVGGGGTFAGGSSRTVTATAKSGYTFANWTENGGVVSASASYTFTLNANRTLVANFTLNPVNYTIAVSAAPGTGGLVSGGGTFAAGSSHTVTAIANSGYAFANWTENGSVVSSIGGYNFTLNANRNLVANFTVINYTIAVNASPGAGGSVSGAGTFAANSSRTVKATSSSGYTFSNWTENGNVVSLAASYTFTLTGNRDLVANFTQNPVTYKLTVTASLSAGGLVAGGGTFAAGSFQTVTATVKAGYAFANWTDNGSVVSSSASYSFTLNANRELVANFTVITYTIAVSASPNADGSVTGSGTYPSGSSRTVKATVTNGFTFVNWTENGIVVSSSASFTFTLTGDRDLVANFKPTPGKCSVVVSALPVADGTVSGSGIFPVGSSRTVKATVKSAYLFTSWTEGGTMVSTAASYTFILNNNRSLVSNFIPKPNYTISLSASPGAGGTVTGGGTYLAGSSKLVKATVKSGYLFASWTEGGTVVSTAASYTFTLNANRTLVANFRPKSAITYTITTTAAPGSGGLVGGNGTFPAGTAQMVTATANDGYSFANWTENGKIVSSSTSYNFTLNANRNLVANFNVIQYAIAVRALPSAGGAVGGGGTFDAGSSQMVTATANYGYTFTNWTESGTVVSASVSYAFTLTGNRNLVANFTKNSAAQNLLGTWSGTWSGQSAGPQWAGPTTTPVSGTWTLVIQSVDTTSNSAAGTLAWDGMDAYWIYTFDGLGNITSATPEPFIPNRTIAFDNSNTTLTASGTTGQFQLTVDGTAGAQNPSDAFYGPWFSVTVDTKSDGVTTQGNGFLTHPYNPANSDTGLSSGTVTGSRVIP